MQKRRRRKRNKVNPILMGDDAIESAREALFAVAAETGVDNGDEVVGDYRGSEVNSADSVTHRFDASVPGYRGWEWIAVVAAVPGDDRVTINEATLIPSKGALQAPEWIPYRDRILPGDLRPGDNLPPADDDRRLTPLAPESARAGGKNPQATHRKLTKWGIDDTRTRWRRGSHGPNSEFAEKAVLYCKTCAFFVPLDGDWGREFGACVNEFSADGRVVHRAFGCGAHSDTPAERGAGSPEARAWDDTGYMGL